MQTAPIPKSLVSDGGIGVSCAGKFFFFIFDEGKVVKMVVVSNPALRMLWLELTQSCNEHCAHCYNDSGPHHAGDKTLAQGDWFRILTEARECGASEVQFIGGEPTLIPWLPEALAHARMLGYEMIEVFTNGTKLSDAVVETFREQGIRVAVSLYSHNPELHDQMTGLPGSHARTVEGLRRLQIAEVPTRVAVIRVPLNKEGCEATVQFARELGIENAGIDDARAFGRAQALTGRTPQLKELCGHCWNGTLCIDPQGQVSPCIMSRHFVVGNAGSTSMGEILASPALAGKREEIYREVWVPRQEVTACQPNSPYPPGCFPSSTPPNPCGPNVIRNVRLKLSRPGRQGVGENTGAGPAPHLARKSTDGCRIPCSSAFTCGLASM